MWSDVSIRSQQSTIRCSARLVWGHPLGTATQQRANPRFVRGGLHQGHRVCVDYIDGDFPEFFVVIARKQWGNVRLERRPDWGCCIGSSHAIRLRDPDCKMNAKHPASASRRSLIAADINPSHDARGSPRRTIRPHPGQIMPLTVPSAGIVLVKKLALASVAA
jgi:hypothetical protein